MQANKWALKALRALNLKPVSPDSPPEEATPPPVAAAIATTRRCSDAKSPVYFSPLAFPPVNLAKACMRLTLLPSTPLQCNPLCVHTVRCAGKQDKSAASQLRPAGLEDGPHPGR